MATIPADILGPGLLAATLFGKTRRQLLGWLFTHTDESFYVRELLRLSGAAPGAVSRELEKVTAAGILRRTSRGNQVFYQADEACPIFGELKSIFLKTAGLTDQIRSALAAIAGRISIAAIYGSAARRTLRAPSDVDLLIVGDVSFGEVVSALAPAQSSLGREINPTVYPRAKFRSKLRAGSHFLMTLMKEPVQFVLGDLRELERLGAKRPGHRPPDNTTRNRRPLRRRRP